MQTSYLYAWTSCVHGAGQGRICLGASLLGRLPVLGLCLQSWGLDYVESPWEAAYWKACSLALLPTLTLIPTSASCEGGLGPTWVQLSPQLPSPPSGPSRCVPKVLLWSGFQLVPQIFLTRNVLVHNGSAGEDSFVENVLCFHCSVFSLLSDPSHHVYHDFCGKMHFEFQELTLKWNLEYIPFVGSVRSVDSYR